MNKPENGGAAEPMPLDVTLAEVWRRLGRSEADQRERLRAVDDRINVMSREMVPLAVYEERDSGIRARVKGLEDDADRAATYRRNLLIAIIASVAGSLGAVVASLIAVLVH